MLCEEMGSSDLALEREAQEPLSLPDIWGSECVQLHRSLLWLSLSILSVASLSRILDALITKLLLVHLAHFPP